MKVLFVVIWFLLAAALTVSAAGEDREARLEEIVARYREIVEHREEPGGKSLQDVLSWFAKIEPQGESGLSMRLMKARTQGVNVYTGEHSWKAIGAGNTVNIRSGEKKRIWAVGISLDIGLDNAIFPAEGCPWLSNSVHTVYVQMRASNEFHSTVKVDSYVISLDRKRAYYCEGKCEVAYPFPFTSFWYNVHMRKNRVVEQNRCHHLVSRLAHRAFFLDPQGGAPSRCATYERRSKMLHLLG